MVPTLGGSAGRTTDEARVVAGQGAGALAALDMLATGTEVARLQNSG
ncbi:MAG: hypothetical protein SFU84_06320 [Gemmatimonadales bacterium]|nr:hypothetical protein [Gemmatimonadales bacterium]